MEYINYDMNAYNLHVIKTDKFKTITVDVCFRRKINKDEITIRNLLKDMMIDASYNYPDEKSLVIETENLYDLKLLASGYRVGNYSIISFKCRFLHEKYTESGMNEESIKFLLDVIFNPYFGKNIDKCKEKLRKSIISLKDNKIKYSLCKLLHSVDDRPYSYSEYGNLADIDKIDVSCLKEYYDSVINNDLIDIFVVGDVSENFIKGIFRDNFNVNTFHKNNIDVIVPEIASVDKVHEIRELDNVNQMQFTLLCDMHNITDYERKYVLPVYGELLGGSANSMLFDAVREKNSYAYYVNAIVKPYDNIMMIYSGINGDNSQEVYKIIEKSLKGINHGKIDIKKLDNAKKTLCSAIITSMDSPSGIINNAYAMVLVNSLGVDDRISKIEAVSREDIINVSKKINIHTKFLLEATNEED